MSTPAPGGYRIADEFEVSAVKRGKLPWPLFGLFVLTILFAPIGALMFGLNWARLGYPEKRAAVFAAGVLALLLPFLLAFSARAMNFTLEPATLRTMVSFAAIVIAYWQLLGQKPHYDAHIARGGERANALWLWGAALLAILFFVGAAFLRAML